MERGENQNLFVSRENWGVWEMPDSGSSDKILWEEPRNAEVCKGIFLNLNIT